MSKKGACSPARVRVGTLLFLCVNNLPNHPLASRRGAQRALSGGSHPGSIWHKTHKEKCTEKTIQEREWVCFRREVCREKSVDFFFFLRKQAPENELLERDRLCRKSSQKEKKETKLRSNPNENSPSLLHKEQKWEMEVEM